MLAGHGITVQSNCGIVGPIVFQDILYESSRGPFLTLDSLTPYTNPMIAGIELHNVVMSDEFFDATGSRPPILFAKAPIRIWSVQITNSSASSYVCKDGVPIDDLEVWSLAGCYVRGQNSGYLLSTHLGVVDTRPQLNPATFSLNGAAATSFKSLPVVGQSHKREPSNQ